MDRAKEIKAYVAEAAAACEHGDLDWFTAMAEQEAGGHVDPGIVEMAMHMATYSNLAVNAPKRRESQKWLADRGVRTPNGLPISESDPLPSRFDGCH